VTSLQKRLRLGLASSVMLLMGLLWWMVSGAIEKFGEEFVQARLVHDADSLLAGLQADNNNGLQLTAGRMGTIYQTPFSGHYFSVITQEKEIYSRSLWDETLKTPLLKKGDTRQWREKGPSGQVLLVWSGGFQKLGHLITVAVAKDLTPLSKSLVRFNWYFAGLSLLVLMVLLLIQHYIVRRSFRPLEKVRQEVKNLQQGALLTLTEEVPDEVRPLVQEVNHLLRLLSERLQRSRNAMGNLAHSLKAPLSLLTQLSQQGAQSSAQQDDRPATPDFFEELNKHTHHIRQLMDRELKRARLMGQGSPGARFSPQEEMPILIDVLQRMFEVRQNGVDKKLDIQWQSTEVVFMFDRDDMLELIGNLLDNACKWADHQVRCEINGDEQHLQFIVEDDGPGCPDEEIARLTTRGVRLDESALGHGLGLSIVKDIVETYDGSLIMECSAGLGGLKVTVRLGVRSSVWN